MKVNLKLNGDGLIIGFSIMPFDPSLPSVDVDDPYSDIAVGVDSLVDGRIAKGTPKEDTYGKILELKKKLAGTDYKLMKFMEGELTEDEYAPIREERKSWRAQINELQGSGD